MTRWSRVFAAHLIKYDRLFHKNQTLEIHIKMSWFFVLGLIQTDVRKCIFDQLYNMCLLPFELDPPNPQLYYTGKEEIAPKFDLVLNFELRGELTWDQGLIWSLLQRVK